LEVPVRLSISAYSVFEWVLTGRNYEEQLRRLKRRVKLEQDSLRFHPLSRQTLGQVETWAMGHL
jgi:CRISPR-associated protein Cas2